MYLADPTIDVRLRSSALTLSEVIKDQRPIFRIATVFRQLVLRDAHVRCRFLNDPTIGRGEADVSARLCW